jgi:hypothetical protein
MVSPRILSLAALLVFLSLTAGCGSDIARVSGQVKLDGQPLPKASITFQPQEEGRPSVAITDDNGNYELLYKPDVSGAKVGKHTVIITTAWEDDDTRVKEKLPAKYHAKSELVEEVKSGRNVINFDLQSK